MVGIPRRLHGVGVLVALAALATTQGVQAAAVLDLVQDTEGREIEFKRKRKVSTEVTPSAGEQNQHEPLR